MERQLTVQLVRRDECPEQGSGSLRDSRQLSAQWRYGGKIPAQPTAPSDASTDSFAVPRPTAAAAKKTRHTPRPFLKPPPRGGKIPSHQAPRSKAKKAPPRRWP